MPYTFSDHFFPTALTNSINSTQTTIEVDTLDSQFVTDVSNASDPAFPLRIGRGAAQERVLVTGIADAANNKLTIFRGEEYGAKSHNAGSRVAHAVAEQTITAIQGTRIAVRMQENGPVEHLYVPDQDKLYEDSAATVQASIDGPVGAWEDQSGDHLATQSTTANKPTLRQDANGKLYVEFVANEDFLETDLTTQKTTKTSTIPGVGAFSAEVDPSLKGRTKARIQSTTAGVLLRGGTYSQDIRGDWAAVLDQRGKDVADNVTSLADYFRDEPLIDYDAHAQNTSSVTDMGFMFDGTSVSDLSPLSGWDTSSVTDMGVMFRDTSVSDLLPLSGWDTSQVTNMRNMFRNTSVSDLSPLSGWDTSSVTNMGVMFDGTSVSDLSPLSGWDTSSVTDMGFMFQGTSVSDLSPLSGWDTSQVTDMRTMFRNTSVSDLSPLSGWDTSSVTDMGVMFRDTSVSDPSTISGWDVGAVTDFTSFLEGAPLDSANTGDMLAGWTDGSPNLASNMESGVTLGIQQADYNNMNASGQTAVDDLCCSTAGCTSNGNTGPNWTINATNAPADCS